MLGIHDFPLFVISCILLNIAPGQDTFYIIGRSVAQGRRAGLFSVMGIMSGVLVHTLLAALGLSVILATSSVAFAVVKYAGAAYLIWMGIGMLLGGNGDAGVSHGPSGVDGWTIFRQGLLTNVLNPKVALFFLSFLPQFVSPSASSAFLPFLVLGLVFFTTGTLWCLFLARGAAWLSGRFGKGGSAGNWLKKCTGGLFVALGVRLAFAQRG